MTEEQGSSSKSMAAWRTTWMSTEACPSLHVGGHSSQCFQSQAEAALQKAMWAMCNDIKDCY